MLINRALKLTRQFHRLTQTNMAARLEISKSFLSELEAGKKTPTLDLLERYARVFEIPASTFLLFQERLEQPSGAAQRKRAEKVLHFLEWAAAGEDDASGAA